MSTREGFNPVMAMLDLIETLSTCRNRCECASDDDVELARDVVAWLTHELSERRLRGAQRAPVDGDDEARKRELKRARNQRWRDAQKTLEKTQKRRSEDAAKDAPEDARNSSSESSSDPDSASEGREEAKSVESLNSSPSQASSLKSEKTQIVRVLREGGKTLGRRSEDAKEDAPEDAAKDARAQAWLAYSRAFAARYGAEPPRNQTVNSQMAAFCKRVPAAEVVGIVEHYLQSHNAFYVGKKHPVGLLLADAEKLCVEARTRTHSTVAGARRVDHRADRLEQYQGLFEELAAEDEAEAKLANGGAA